MLVNIYESLFYFEDFQEVVMRTPAEIQNIMELCDEDSEDLQILVHGFIPLCKKLIRYLTCVLLFR